MLGGLLFSVPAIFVARRLVHLEDSILDAYAFVLPLGMCIQRIGCFLNGCCFGSTTSGWGVQYRTRHLAIPAPFCRWILFVDGRALPVSSPCTALRIVGLSACRPLLV